MVRFIEQAKFTADQFDVEIETAIDDAHTLASPPRAGSIPLSVSA